MKFVHLHTHTHYSLLDGLTRMDELVNRVKELGMDACAITDHGVLYGAVEFYKKCKKAGIKPIIGMEAYVTDNMLDKRPEGDGRHSYHLILLAKNQTGYKNLIQLTTAGHLEGFYYKPKVDKDRLRRHNDGLIALSACLGGEVPRALMADNYAKAKKLALEHQEIFGKENYYLEIQIHPHLEEQGPVTEQLIRLSRETGIPLAATQDSHYLKSEDAKAHDILLAVQTGNQVDDKDRLTLRHDDFSLQSPEMMAEKFAHIPEALENTAKIAAQCDLELELGKAQLPEFPLPAGHDANSYLKELAWAGLQKRFGPGPDEAIVQRFNYELSVITKTGFASYFLIVQDFVNWAKQSGIIVGPGRGSAAGSLVSYALGITNIDPLKYDLYFERFLNPERISPPDIDLDFDDARRSEVFAYVRDKYGHDRFAQIITFGTMRARAAVRDAGRAMGYAYDYCDQVAKLIPFNPDQNEKIGFLKKCLETVTELKQFYASDEKAKALLDAAMRLEGVARHCSTHACAVVIAPTPLVGLVPLQRGTKEGEIITQYDMHAVEDLGLLKMDFLGLSNLTIIHHTLQLVKQNYGRALDIDTLPLDDAATFKLLQDGNTRGVFQLESNGMTRYLKELKPTVFEDIAVMISLFRPGPMELIPEFIARKHGRKKIEYLHPKLEPVLVNTHGIMIYQEQLMAAARALAGFTLPQADTLRKAVGKKVKALLREQEAHVIQGCLDQGVSKEVADKFWKLIEPFDRYGFPKAHAVSYAMITYQTAYLKAHYPVEFMAAWLNSASDDIERIALLIEECQAMGIEVQAPEINESYEGFSVTAKRPETIDNGQNGAALDHSPSAISGKRIRFGLAAIKHVGVNIVRAVIEERDKHGVFTGLENFITRVQHKDLNKKSLESLVKCGALDRFGQRAVLLANVDQLLEYARESQRSSAGGQASLFAGLVGSMAAPALRLKEAPPVSRAERLMWEKELLGLFISDHPLKDYAKQMSDESGMSQIKDIGQAFGKPVKVGGVVTKLQKILTKTGKPMVFSWIEDLTSKIEVVVFPDVLERHPDAFQENSVVIVSGKLNDKDGIPKLLCESVRPIALLS